MKCQILFKGQIKTNVTNLSTAELAERVVRIKIPSKKKNKRMLKPFLLIRVHYLDKKKTKNVKSCIYKTEACVNNHMLPISRAILTSY